MRRIIGIATVALAAGACGNQDATVTEGTPGPGTVYTATGTVLEAADGVPQLCTGGVAESLPPQCSGVELVGWSWSDANGAESAGGTTWGEYTVTGTYDGERLTLTEPPTPPADEPAPGADDRLDTPCPEPEGGWHPIEPRTTTSDRMYAALDHAAAQPEYAGSWLDRSMNPVADDEPDTIAEEEAMSDPAKLVLNVRFTDRLDEHEEGLREMWGGALCVSDAERTEAELLDVQAELQGEPGVVGSGVDTLTGTVSVQVVVDDGVQARLDEEYGEGVVQVSAVLQPVS